MRDARFWARVAKGEGCWLWQGSVSPNGYGRLTVDGEVVGAHRFAFELTSGAAVPDGFYVCHRCDNPTCVRPDHLFLGTPKDNVDDMIAKGRQRLTGRPKAKPTHCKRGHEYTPENTGYWGPNQHRHCRTCNAESAQRRRRRAA